MLALPSEHYAVLSLYLILLLHKIVDRLLIINDIKITMNSVLDYRGSHRKSTISLGSIFSISA